MRQFNPPAGVTKIFFPGDVSDRCACKGNMAIAMGSTINRIPVLRPHKVLSQ
ncbi:hypothetical protein SAMN05216386_2004 [Nitrosospira briensis]|uniref:Uncharacterized protein n=1 Tax=Nitrosospira briensis TaxID=35799 RepID=A0A1I5C7Z1_9PROT|nr:hypothetical protein SAMN05216386_2004 [Nitrosospira briensis]